MKRDKLLCSLIAVSLILQGCTDKPKDDWLVGMWTSMEESCEGEAYIDFKETGQFAVNTVSEGLWKLEGKTIVMVTTNEFDDDTLEIKPVKKPPTKIQITSHDPNTFSAVGADGTNVDWKRCSFGSDMSIDREASDTSSPAASTKTNDTVLEPRDLVVVRGSDFLGKFSNETIHGKTFVDAEDVKTAILALPSGVSVLRKTQDAMRRFNVAAPVKEDETGSLILSLCQQNNCGGNNGGQMLIEFSPEYKTAFICINDNRGSVNYTIYGKEFVGEECAEGAFYYGD